MSAYRFGCDDYHLNYDPPEASDGCGGTDWEKVESVEIEGVTFTRTPDCSTCTERRGHYEDAETIRRQQERINSLVAEIGDLEWRVPELTIKLAERDKLLRDMLVCITVDGYDCYGCPIDECDGQDRMTSCLLVERARKMGIEVES